MLKSIYRWITSLVARFNKPLTYGSDLEQYITSHNPQCSADVDRLAREYSHKQAAMDWARGY